MVKARITRDQNVPVFIWNNIFLFIYNNKWDYWEKECFGVPENKKEDEMETTIAAISTAMSASGIGIIRISGENAMDVISRIYRSKGGKKQIKEQPTHTIHYG